MMTTKAQIRIHPAIECQRLFEEKTHDYYEGTFDKDDDGQYTDAVQADDFVLFMSGYQAAVANLPCITKEEMVELIARGISGPYADHSIVVASDKFRGKKTVPRWTLNTLVAEKACAAITTKFPHIVRNA